MEKILVVNVVLVEYYSVFDRTRIVNTIYLSNKYVKVLILL